MNPELLLQTLSYRQLVLVLKTLRGGSVGFDPNRNPETKTKLGLITYIINKGGNCMTSPTMGELRKTVDQVRGETHQPPPAGLLMAAPRRAADDNDTNTTETTTMGNAAPAKAENIQQIAAALAAMMQGTDEKEVRRIATEITSEHTAPILQHLAQLDDLVKDKPQRIIIENKATATEHDAGIQHKQFSTLVKLLACRTSSAEPLNIWLTGPAGSGKTTAARNAAKALELPFYFNGAIDNEYKLLGFTDAQGRIVSRPFREVWTHGGLYLFDEVDASMPGALLAFNAALANGRCDFPDGCVERHKDCVIIPAANTFGQGATADYVGRVKQDAAFLDRFVQLAWEIDEKLERALCSNHDWVNLVQRYRRKAKDLGLRVIISPRASMFGEAMLAGGFTVAEAEAMAIRKGMTDEQWNSLSR